MQFVKKGNTLFKGVNDIFEHVFGLIKNYFFISYSLNCNESKMCLTNSEPLVQPLPLLVYFFEQYIIGLFSDPQ